MGDEQLEQRRNEDRRRDAVGADDVGESAGVALCARVSDQNTRADDEGQQQFPHSTVKTDRRLGENGVGVSDTAAGHRLHAPPQHVHHAAVGDHHALRPARRTRRVDHIGRVVGTYVRQRSVRGRRHRVRRVLIEETVVDADRRDADRGATDCGQCRAAASDDDGGGVRVVEDRCDPVGRCVGVDRKVGRTRAQYAL